MNMLNVIKSMTTQLREDWTRMVCLEGLPGKRLFCMKSMAVWLRFVRLLLNKPQDFWTVSHEQMRPHWNCLALIPSGMFGENQISAKPPHANYHEWRWRGNGLGLLCSNGIWELEVTESIMNSAVYQCILEANVRPSGWQRMQQDNDLQHTS